MSLWPDFSIVRMSTKFTSVTATATIQHFISSPDTSFGYSFSNVMWPKLNASICLSSTFYVSINARANIYNIQFKYNKDNKHNKYIPAFMPELCHQFEITFTNSWFLICSSQSSTIKKKLCQRWASLKKKRNSRIESKLNTDWLLVIQWTMTNKALYLLFLCSLLQLHIHFLIILLSTSADLTHNIRDLNAVRSFFYFTSFPLWQLFPLFIIFFCSNQVSKY